MEEFSVSDTAPDYCVPSLEYLAGAFSQDGRLWGVSVLTNSQGQLLLMNQNGGEGLFMWNSLPPSAGTTPDMMNSGSNGFRFFAGDTSGMVIVGNEMFISLDNGNKIVAYNQLPTSSTQNPDFAIGAPDIYTNTLSTNYIMSNPQPITDGKSLFVVSDFDEMLYVYKNIPDESNAHPDIVYNLGDAGMQPIQGALYGHTFVLVGMENGQPAVLIWKNSLPFGQPPDETLQGSIGSASLQQLSGVALDGNYLYLADSGANKIYVFQGLPASSSSNPIYTLPFNAPGRLSSDGTYLVVTPGFGRASPSSPTGPTPTSIYAVPSLSSNSQPIAVQAATTNTPQMVLSSDGKLFAPDVQSGRVLIWNSISQAINGSGASTTLGCTLDTAQCSTPQIGRNELFWPAFAAYDGTFLWVGEYKFSEQLLRFSGSTIPGSQIFTLSYDGSSYSIPVSTSTSTITDLAFNPAQAALRINIAEPTSSGSLKVTYPKAILNGSLIATIDGAQTSFKQTQNSSYSSVTVNYAQGAHTIVLSCSTCSSSTSVTSSTSTSTISTATSSSSTSLVGSQGGQPSVNISPSSGPSGTLVTISGSGLTPNHTYKYCYQAGSPPHPPSPSVPCQASASIFTTSSDGSIPSSPAVTLEIVGSSGQYTVEISDSTNQFVIPFGFMITGGISSASTTGSLSTIASTQAVSTSSMLTTSTAPSAPDYTLWGGIAAVIIVVAGLGTFALKKKK